MIARVKLCPGLASFFLLARFSCELTTSGVLKGMIVVVSDTFARSARAHHEFPRRCLKIWTQNKLCPDVLHQSDDHFFAVNIASVALKD